MAAEIQDPKKDYFFNSDSVDVAIGQMEKTLVFLRTKNLEQAKDDFLGICAAALNSPNKSTSTQKIRLALVLGEYYAHFKIGDEKTGASKAAAIYHALMSGDPTNLGGIQVIDHRKTPAEQVSLQTVLTGAFPTEKVDSDGNKTIEGAASLPYMLQATARYHDLVNRGTPNRKNLDSAIAGITKALQGQAATEETLYCFIESYSILAKLLAATKDPKLEAEALKIAAMLRSPEPVKGTKPEPIALNIGGETLSLPWVNASDKGATYFRTSAANTELQLLGEKENLSPAESARAMALAEEILASGSMADSYMTAATKRIKADILMGLDIKDEAKKEAVLRQAKALYTDALYSGSDDSYLIAKSAAGLAQIALVLDKDPGRALALANAVLGEGSSRVEAVPGRAATVPPIKNDPNTFAMTRIVKIEAEIMLLQNRMAEILSSNRNLSTSELESLPEYRQAAEALLAVRKSAVPILENTMNGTVQGPNKYTEDYARLALAKVYLLSDTGHAIAGTVTNDAIKAFEILKDFASSYPYIELSARAKTAQAYLVFNSSRDEGAEKEKYLAYSRLLCEEILSDGNCYADVKREAALTLANVFQAQKAPEAARALFEALLNGGRVTAGGREMAVPKLKDNDTYAEASAQMGAAEAIRSVVPRDYDEQKDIRETSIASATKAAASTTDKDTRDAASLLIAEFQASRTETMPEAKTLFSRVLGTSHKVNNMRARLGLAILNLSDKAPEASLQKGVEDLIDIINESADDKELQYIGQRALVELAGYLARFESAKPAALALLDRLIDGTAMPPALAGRVSYGVSRDVHKPADVTAAFTAALGDGKAFEEALAGAEKLPEDEQYLLASARTMRGSMLIYERDPSLREKAASDLQAVVDMAKPSGPEQRPAFYDKITELQARASGLLAQHRAGALSSRELHSELGGIIAETSERLVSGEFDEIPYSTARARLAQMSAEIELAKKLPDEERQVRGGHIISELEFIVSSFSFDPFTKNDAKALLVTAYQTFGAPEKAKKLNEELLNAPDTELTQSAAANALKTMSVLEIGDNRFKIAALYSFEADKRAQSNDPEAKIYLGRQMFLTEKFGPREFMAYYEEALDKIWEMIPKKGDPLLSGSNRPKMEEIVACAFAADDPGKHGPDAARLFGALSASNDGKFLILTALEAQAKLHYARGDAFKAEKNLELAIGLFEAWNNNEKPISADYLFEGQLHYDLAACYMARGRVHDAFTQYSLIRDKNLAPGWWVDEQLKALNRDTLQITKSGDEDLNVVWRRAFEKGVFRMSASKTGASAEALVYLDRDKVHAVRVRFGAARQGRIDAGMAYEFNKGRFSGSVGARYSRSPYEKGITNEVIGFDAQAQMRVNRHLTVGVGGKVEMNSNDFDYTTWELRAFANYARRIGKNLTFFANAEAAIGVDRLKAYKYGWIDTFKSPESYESSWIWPRDNYCHTNKDSKPFRERYWRITDTWDNPGPDGQKLVVWSLDTAIEPETKTEYIPDLNGVANDLKIELNSIYQSGHLRENAPDVHMNADNFLALPPGQKPSAQDIRGRFSPDNLPTAPGREKVLIHEEWVSQPPTYTPTSTSVTVMGRDRQTPAGQWPSESDPFVEKALYTITVTKDARTGQTTVRKNDHVTGASELIYQGQSTEEAVLVLEKYMRGTIEAGVEQKIPTGLGVLTLRGSVFAETVKFDDPGLDKEKYYVEDRDRTEYGLKGSASLSSGASTVGVSAKLANTNGEWDVSTGVSASRALGAGSSISGDIGNQGAQIGLGVDRIYIGVNSRGGIVLGIMLPDMTVDGTTIIGDVPLTVDSRGNIALAGLGLSAVNPISLALSSIILSFDSTKNLNKLRQDLAELSAKLNTSEDSRIRAVIRNKIAENFIQSGKYTAQWGQDTPRLPVINLLTSLFGTREAKNRHKVDELARELVYDLEELDRSGAMGWYASDSEVTHEAARDYVLADTVLPREADGKWRRSADMQTKIVKAVTTPVRVPLKLLTNALGITSPATEAGAVSKRSFDSLDVDRKALWSALLELGIIDRKGTVLRTIDRHPEIREGSDIESLESIYGYRKTDGIISVINSAFESGREMTAERTPPAVETPGELRTSYEQKLFEDTMYLIYRMINDGSSAETRSMVAALIDRLPEKTRQDVQGFISSMPEEYQKSLKDGSKYIMPVQAPREVVVTALGGNEELLPAIVLDPDAEQAEFRPDWRRKAEETPDIDRQAQKRLEETHKTARGSDPKTVRRSDEAVIMDRLEGRDFRTETYMIEEEAKELFKKIGSRGMEAAADGAIDLLNESAAAGDRDGIYRQALVLFMIAGTSDNNAGMIADRLSSLEGNVLAAVAERQRDLLDFYINRRPGSAKVFGGRKTKVKVEGPWGQQGKALRATLAAEDYIKLALNGNDSVRKETVRQNARAVARKDFRGIRVNGAISKYAFSETVLNEDLLYGELVNRGYIDGSGNVTDAFRSVKSAARMGLPAEYERQRAKIFEILSGALDENAVFDALVMKQYINQNGVIQEPLRDLKSEDNREAALEDFDLPFDAATKARILDVLTRDKTSSRLAVERDNSVRDIRQDARAISAERKTAQPEMTPQQIADINARRAILTAQPAQAPAAEPEVVEAEEAALLAMPAQKEEPPAAKTAEGDKEAGKAARAARRDAARQRYGVGTHRSRRR